MIERKHLKISKTKRNELHRMKSNKCSCILSNYKNVFAFLYKILSPYVIYIYNTNLSWNESKGNTDHEDHK